MSDKPQIALTVIGSGQVRVSIQHYLTLPASVALMKVLVQQLAGMHGMLPGEFLKQVRGSLHMPATVSGASGLIYNG